MSVERVPNPQQAQAENGGDGGGGGGGSSNSCHNHSSVAAEATSQVLTQLTAALPRIIERGTGGQ